MNHDLEPWELRQVSLAREAVRGFLSREVRSSEEKDKGPLRCGLFDLLYEHLLVELKAKKQLPDPNPKALAERLYALTNAEYMVAASRRGGNLRAIKSGLNKSLDSFEAEYRNKRWSWSFGLSNGRWRVDVDRRDNAMKAFWEPYFAQSEANYSVTIAYGEQVFFRGGRELRSFIRHMDVNDPESVSEVRKNCDLPSDWTLLQGGTQFVSAGDCAAVIKLGQRFERNGLRTQVKTAKEFAHWQSNKEEGLIVVGSSRTLPWIAKRLAEERFAYQIAPNGIVDTRPNGAEHVDDFSPGRPVRGMISRTYCKDLRCWLTIISNNHGRCSQSWVDYVFSENNMSRIFERVGSDSLPERFQIIIDVLVDSLEGPQPPAGGSPVSIVDYVAG